MDFKIIVSLTVLVTSIAFRSITLRGAYYESSPPDIGVVSNNTMAECDGNNTTQKAMEAMRSKGYTLMALLLETQPVVMDPQESKSKFLIVAPSDKAVARVKGELSPVLLRHIVKLNCSRIEEGFARTFLPGFVITVTFMEEFEVRPNAPIDSLYEDDKNMLRVFGIQEEIFPPMLEKDVVNKRI